MLAFLLGLFRLIWLFGKDHRGVVLENLALRQQLSIYRRQQKRPGLALPPSSEDQLQRQLDLPWLVGLPINHSVATGVIHFCSRRAELHAVEGVKELGAKLGDEFTLLEGVVLEER